LWPNLLMPAIFNSFFTLGAKPFVTRLAHIFVVNRFLCWLGIFALLAMSWLQPSAPSVQHAVHFSSVVEYTTPSPSQGGDASTLVNDLTPALEAEVSDTEWRRYAETPSGSVLSARRTRPLSASTMPEDWLTSPGLRPPIRAL
jgi:hypothetical protein